MKFLHWLLLAFTTDSPTLLRLHLATVATRAHTVLAYSHTTRRLIDDDTCSLNYVLAGQLEMIRWGLAYPIPGEWA